MDISAEIATWETYMDFYGKSLGDRIIANPDLTSISARDDVYYDSQRTFYQIADYRNEVEPWYTYAQQARAIYIDNYAAPTYQVAGHWRFPHGVREDWLRTGSLPAKQNIVDLRDLPPVSNPETSGTAYKWYWSGLSREVAYALNAHIAAEKTDFPRNEIRVQLFMEMAFNHIYEWTTGDYGQNDPLYERVAPFMIGLTAETLIDFCEWERENGRSPQYRSSLNNATLVSVSDKLKEIGDHLLTALVTGGPNLGLPMWIEDYNATGYGCFRYEDSEISGTGTTAAPALNQLVAPLYAWLYKEFGSLTYRDMAQKLFAGGVVLTGTGIDTQGKFFNQNYRSSFNTLKWLDSSLDRELMFCVDALMELWRIRYNIRDNAASYGTTSISTINQDGVQFLKRIQKIKIMNSEPYSTMFDNSLPDFLTTRAAVDASFNAIQTVANYLISATNPADAQSYVLLNLPAVASTALNDIGARLKLMKPSVDDTALIAAPNELEKVIALDNMRKLVDITGENSLTYRQ